MPFSLQDSDLWKAALAPRENDPHHASRDLLRTTLLQMHASVGRLVTQIPADCRDLTIHDVSHLDALWEMADLVAGGDFSLTPVEAFVFGAAVLLHDAGLTFAAYPGGLPALRETMEWRDTFSAHERRHRLAGSSPGSEDMEREVAFEVLRRLHAAQAANLATQSWEIQPSGETVYLISDVEIRQSYGISIGKIAHSHHWSIDRVAEELRDGLGAASDLPKEWTLSERKVACLLRCADIAHVDRRRAPTILLAAQNIGSSSKPHWQFQNKLNKPVLRDGALLYSSGADFGLAEADSWWLAYEVLRAIDGELRTSNALLSENRIEPFAAQRVAGSETPRALSKFVTTSGWKPVDTEIRVTDPIHLAKTLGGANLYGSDLLAPIRELIQNSVDAVRARRTIEGRPADWGKISVHVKTESDGRTWLSIEDNGIGMSERVLTGPLLDFGKSFWTSGLLQEEFPGLQTLGLDPVGKFGIGFFSVFLLGQDVLITSRKYTGDSKFKTLAFSGLSRRPILRDAYSDEIPLDSSTRIKIALTDPQVLRGNISYKKADYFGSSYNVSATHVLSTVISCVDVDIAFKDHDTGLSLNHSHDWLSRPAEEFLSSISRDLVPEWNDEEISAAHADLIKEVKDEKDGRSYGRAALNVTPSMGRASAAFARVAVGGFVVSPNEDRDSFYVGVLSGETNVASRSKAEIAVPAVVLREWANQQIKLIDRKKVHPSDQLAVCHTALSLGADALDFPFCLTTQGLASVSQFRAKIEHARFVLLPVTLRSREHRGDDMPIFKYESLSAISQDVLFYSLREHFVSIVGSDSDVLRRDPEEVDIEEEYKTTGKVSVDEQNLIELDELKLLVRELRAAWGPQLEFSLVRHVHLDMELYRRSSDQWALKISRE